MVPKSAVCLQKSQNQLFVYISIAILAVCLLLQSWTSLIFLARKLRHFSTILNHLVFRLLSRLTSLIYNLLRKKGKKVLPNCKFSAIVFLNVVTKCSRWYINVSQGIFAILFVILVLVIPQLSSFSIIDKPSSLHQLSETFGADHQHM